MAGGAILKVGWTASGIDIDKETSANDK
jgi:hypothetical protein